MVAVVLPARRNKKKAKTKGVTDGFARKVLEIARLTLRWETEWV